MLEVERTKNAHGYDVFIIQTDDGMFDISFQNNLDLYWSYLCSSNVLEHSPTKEFTITKENYHIYQLFDKLYHTVKSGNPFENQNDKSYLSNELFHDDVIDWYSDDFVYEYASRVVIEKDEENELYKVTFHKNKENYDEFFIGTFAVRFRTSGSRYNYFYIPFMKMYQELKEYNPDCHQIHFEEYLYKQKVLTKEKK